MISVIDIEADSHIADEANLKFLFAKDLGACKKFVWDYTEKDEIIKFMDKQKFFVGYNLKGYDVPVLDKFGVKGLTYNMKGVKRFSKGVIDLYECLAPRGDNGFGSTNKNRLHDINPSLNLPNYKLGTVFLGLGLGKLGKGEIDYNIFKKDSWNKEELKEIHKYGFNDIDMEEAIFNWYNKIFEPLEPYLKKSDVNSLKHLTCTSGVLSYMVVCNLAGLKEEYEDFEQARKLKQQAPRIEGGHHIHPRFEQVRGRIQSWDFKSHYPSILIQYKLVEDKIRVAVEKILSERMKAKAEKNKALALALKVPLNSIYGTLGNPTFKNIYNPIAAANCTRIGRELLKKYAKTLDVAGFIPLYGFTDSVYVGIPKKHKQEDLKTLTNWFVDSERDKSPNPLESFGLAKEDDIKFMWFIEKKDNNYLYITDKDEVKIKGGIFDKNTPEVVLKLYEDYIKPKIIKKLEIKFTEEEILKELKKLLKKNPELSAQVYSVKSLKEYNSKTSMQYQVSEKYGEGKHLLIPNTSSIGVGCKINYCSIEEFKKNKLTPENICYDRMLRYIKPFYTTKEEVLDLTKLKEEFS